jgi:hypothetical protein
VVDPKIPGGYYIKARAIQKSSIMRQPPHVREIWDYLLMNANHSDNKYGGYSVKRGQLFRTYKQIREDLSWNVGWRKETYNENQTKKAMKFLRESLMIATAKEPGGVMITVLNYNYYQDPANYERTSEGTDERTIEEPLTNQPVPYNKKKNNIRMEEDIKVQNSEEPNAGSNIDDSDNIISQSDPHRDISPSNENPAEDNSVPGIRAASDGRTDSKTGGVDGTRREANTGGTTTHCSSPEKESYAGSRVLRDENSRSQREDQEDGGQAEKEGQVISKTETTGGDDGRRQEELRNGHNPANAGNSDRHQAGEELEVGDVGKDSQAGGGQQTAPGEDGQPLSAALNPSECGLESAGEYGNVGGGAISHDEGCRTGQQPLPGMGNKANEGHIDISRAKVGYTGGSSREAPGASGTAGEGEREDGLSDCGARGGSGNTYGGTISGSGGKISGDEGQPNHGSATGDKKKKRNGKSINPSGIEEPKYKTSRKKWLKGQRLSDFEIFWNEFGDKRGKPGAAQSWLDLDDYSPDLVKAIIHGAKEYALERFDILERKGTPKMAQGWLTDRRWEDYPMEDQSKQQGRKIDVKKEMAELRARAKQLEIRDANEKRKNGSKIQTAPIDIVKPESGATIESGSNQAAGSALRQLFG